MVIVVGAAGFIGTYLVDRLIEEDYKVIVVDKSGEDLLYYNSKGILGYEADVSSEEDILKLPSTNVDAVINLACVQPANVSKSRSKAIDYIKVNTIGTINLLEYCVHNKVKRFFHVCSHRNTQGMWKEKEGMAIKEVDGRSIKYTGEYAMFSISESAAIDCVEHYHQEFGIEGVVFRLPPVYGYGPHLEIFKDGEPLKTGFQIFVDCAKDGKTINIWGNGNKGRDIVYVKDVVEAFVMALNNKGLSGIYNISSGRELTLKEEAETISCQFGKKGIVVPCVNLPEKKNDIESYYYDISKAKRDFGWEPKYSFEEMLLDYKNEMELGRFSHLIDRRRRLMDND